MYWYLFIGVLVLYLLIKHPIILLGAATIIGINLFLQRGTKRSAETASETATESTIDKEEDVATDRAKNNSEKMSKFAAGFTHRPNSDDTESPEECEFVIKGEDECEFVRSNEMPSFSHDSGSFHLRF